MAARFKHEPQLMTTQECFQEALAEARSMTTAEIKKELIPRGALHGWFIRAYEQVLNERSAS